MLREKIKTPGLSHLSYLIGSGGKAAVIDPRRDCECYLELARAEGLEITHICSEDAEGMDERQRRWQAFLNAANVVSVNQPSLLQPTKPCRPSRLESQAARTGHHRELRPSGLPAGVGRLSRASTQGFLWPAIAQAAQGGTVLAPALHRDEHDSGLARLRNQRRESAWPIRPS